MAHLTFFQANGMEEIKQVLVSEQKSFVKTPKAQYYTSLVLGKGLLTTDGAEWVQTRKELGATFTHRNIAGLYKDVVDSTEKAVSYFVQAGKPQSLNQLMLDIALHITMDLSFGINNKSQIHAIGSVIDELIVHTYRRIVEAITIPHALPTPSNIRFNRIRKNFQAIILEATQSALNTPEGKNFVTQFSRHNVSASAQHIANAMNTLLAAGHETTATSLTWLLYETSKHKEVFEKMNHELKVLNLSSIISSEELFQKTLYTQAVLKEVLRMYPPIWLMGREAIADVQVGKYQVKKKHNVLISPFVVHRMEKYWKNPEAFMPERFLHGGTPDGYMPFGMGPRQCIGEHLAFMEIILVLTGLFQKYTLNINSETHPGFSPHITLRPATPISVTLSKN